VTQNAIDGLPSGSALASSFFGEDIGTIIKDKSKLKPGDLVAWAQTYGNWGPNVVTHVGVYSGNGKVIDRGNSALKERSIDTFKNFLYGVRPKAYGSDTSGSVSMSGAPRSGGTGSRVNLPALSIAAQDAYKEIINALGNEIPPIEVKPTAKVTAKSTAKATTKPAAPTTKIPSVPQKKPTQLPTIPDISQNRSENLTRTIGDRYGADSRLTRSNASPAIGKLIEFHFSVNPGGQSVTASVSDLKRVEEKINSIEFLDMLTSQLVYRLRGDDRARFAIGL
jgi:cell wall-associated NlpC family hydrolase